LRVPVAAVVVPAVMAQLVVVLQPLAVELVA
jgi:hypothetical protein